MSKLFAAAVQAGGGTVLASEPSPFPNMSGDFSTQLSKAAGMNPDVIAAMQTGSDLQNLVKQYNGSPLKAQGVKLALGLLFESDINLIGPDALEGAVYTTPWLWTQDAEARVFAERWMARTGTRPTFAQAGNYSAAWQYLDAVRRAGTDDPDAVVKALEGYKFSDFFIRNGLIRAEDHFVAHDLLVAQIKAKAERKEPGDNAKVIGVVAADSSARPVTVSGCTMPR
jgi:branched-chain amino acid transport system substrate-binding protein